MQSNGIAWHIAQSLADSDACFAPTQCTPADVAREAHGCMTNCVARARYNARASRACAGINAEIGRTNYARMATECMARARVYRRAETIALSWGAK